MPDIDKDLEAATSKLKASATAADTRVKGYLQSAWQRYGIYAALAAGIVIGVLVMLVVDL